MRDRRVLVTGAVILVGACSPTFGSGGFSGDDPGELGGHWLLESDHAGDRRARAVHLSFVLRREESDGHLSFVAAPVGGGYQSGTWRSARSAPDVRARFPATLVLKDGGGERRFPAAVSADGCRLELGTLVDVLGNRAPIIYGALTYRSVRCKEDERPWLTELPSGDFTWWYDVTSTCARRSNAPDAPVANDAMVPVSTFFMLRRQAGLLEIDAPTFGAERATVRVRENGSFELRDEANARTITVLGGIRHRRLTLDHEIHDENGSRWCFFAGDGSAR
jgi:hypothetical protein